MSNELFAIHTANLRAVSDVLDRIFSLTRDSIRRQDLEAESDLTLSAALLLGTKLEVRLGKVLCEPGGFTSEESVEILGRRGQFSRWCHAIDVGFRRRYNKWHLDERSIGSKAASRRDTLQTALVEHLEPIIRMRNTLAHGQWVYALNSKETDRNLELEQLVKRETVLSLRIKDRLAHHYCQLLGDLVSTDCAFERDYESTYHKFVQSLRNLEVADTAAYRAELLDRERRGLRRREGGDEPAANVPQD